MNRSDKKAERGLDLLARLSAVDARFIQEAADHVGEVEGQGQAELSMTRIAPVDRSSRKRRAPRWAAWVGIAAGLVLALCAVLVIRSMTGMRSPMRLSEGEMNGATAPGAASLVSPEEAAVAEVSPEERAAEASPEERAAENSPEEAAAEDRAAVKDDTGTSGGQKSAEAPMERAVVEAQADDTIQIDTLAGRSYQPLDLRTAKSTGLARRMTGEDLSTIDQSIRPSDLGPLIGTVERADGSALVGCKAYRFTGSPDPDQIIILDTGHGHAFYVASPPKP